MGDAIRSLVGSQQLSSSLLTSFSFASSSLQPRIPPKWRLGKRVFSVSHPYLSAGDLVASPVSKTHKQFKMRATVTERTETHQPKWWEKNAGPNMVDIHSAEQFSAALNLARDRLVIVEFYGSWCASCRALFPKLCRTAKLHPEILFLKVNFDENKPMCKTLNVKVLPYFHVYCGSGQLMESFSCSLAKFQKIKDAIELYSRPAADHSLAPSEGIEFLNFEQLNSAAKDETRTSSTA